MPVLKRGEARLSREYGRVFMNLQLDDEVGARGGRLRGAVDAMAHELGRTVARSGWRGTRGRRRPTR